MNSNSVLLTLMLSMLAEIAFTQKYDSLQAAYSYNLKELSQIQISTGSIKSENTEFAPSNIVIITEQMIEERAYQTLVDICQDLPGFDFMMYNDGGGEYPTYNMHRGLGNIGNSEILIMIDGIVQNNISFNWSLLWSYENMFVDVERIEIIQGPGSVMYGAQALSGVINIISKNNFSGASVKSFYGSNLSWGSDIHLGSQLGNSGNLSVAWHKYQSKGDMGIGRYDPGEYFKNNKYPTTLLADYDEAGSYVENTINPKGGQNIPDGFNTENNSYAFRSKVSYKNSELGFFIADAQRGYSSANVPYEYNIADRDNTSHYKSYHIYLKNEYSFRPKIKITSDIVFRSTNILPTSGFKYLYRFPELKKSYSAEAYQGYMEEKILFNINTKNVFLVGIKGALNQKGDRVVSLGEHIGSGNTTNSSWDIAVSGGGLNQTKEYHVFLIKEAAAFFLWDRQWVSNISSSVGLRYDLSSEYGDILTPRFAMDFNPAPVFGIKIMYGTAFRQPSIFELSSEFRGNPNLIPQIIKTTELELTSLSLQDKISVKLNVFYSKIEHLIGKVEDSTMPAGERYENIDKMDISGLSVFLSGQISRYLRIYSNYCFLTGIETDSFFFYQIQRTARHKMNAGFNFKLPDGKFTTDIRMNYVGRRKAYDANAWLQSYENGYGPSYIKANLAISYKFAQKFTARVMIYNVFNTQYYGIGRETGSGFIDDYDYQININPDGHIPAYHPQPGRTYMLNLIFKLSNDE